MSENVIGQGVVKITGDAGPLGASISAALSGMSKPLGDVKKAGQEAADNLGGSFSKAGAVVAAGLAIGAGALIEFGLKSAETYRNYGESILQMQRQTGASAEDLSKLAFAASQTGVSTDQLSTALKFLSKSVDTTSGSTSKGGQAMSEYGIATSDAHGKTLPLNDILLNVADAFQKGVVPQAQQAAVAMAIFGRSGTNMLEMLQKGRQGLIDLENEASKYGLVLTGANLAAVQKATDATREQSAAWKGLQIQIGEQVLPSLTQLTTAFTAGLVDVMPVVSHLVSDVAVPAFTLLATTVSSTTNFVEHHKTLVEALGLVVGAVLVPAFVAWGIAEARVLAVDIVTFLLEAASGAVRAATSIGAMTGSLEAGTASVTAFGVALSAVTVGIGLIILQNQQMQASANKAAAALVSSATSPQQAISELTAKQAQYREEMNKGVDVLGVHITLTDSEAKKAAEAAKGYAAVTAQLGQLRSSMSAASTETSSANDAISGALTAAGLKLRDLGGATTLTDDQLQELADSMNIDLSKATAAQTQKLADMAVKLGYTSDASERLANDTSILSSWTDDATKKTSAFKDALDALVGTQTSAEGAAIQWNQALADMVPKLKGVQYSTDLTTQAGRDEQQAIVNTVDALTKQIEALQKTGESSDQLQPQIQALVGQFDAALASAGLNTQQIQALNSQYNLTPGVLAQVTPAVDTVTGAMNAATGAANSAAGAINNIGGQANNTAALLNANADAMNFFSDGPITTMANKATQLGLSFFNVAGGINAVTAQIQSDTGAINASIDAVSRAQGASGPVQWGHPQAAGGPVYPGVTYPVGEKGPELFTPNTSGTIIPNDVLTAMSARAQTPTAVYSPPAAGPTINITVQGSVIAESDLMEKARTYANTYNARAGGGR